MLRLTGKEWLTAPFMVGISFYGRYFLLWSFHIWYKVMNSTCYIFRHYFFFIGAVKLLQFLRLLQKLMLYYFYSNVSCQTQRKNHSSKMWKHKLEETFSDVIWDVHLGRFILLIVPISQQLPRLTSLYFFSFLNRPLKFDCTFPWQHSEGSEQLFTPESWKLFPCK